MQGLEKPVPIGTRQSTFKPSGGNDWSNPVSCQTASRRGPRHCGQSSAHNTARPSARIATAIVIARPRDGTGSNFCIGFTSRDSLPSTPQGKFRFATIFVGDVRIRIAAVNVFHPPFTQSTLPVHGLPAIVAAVCSKANRHENFVARGDRPRAGVRANRPASPTP
jgi:hypothetical protein